MVDDRQSPSKSDAATIERRGESDILLAQNRRLKADIADSDVLFREVHHRIKNNLQILNSLVMMIGTRFADPKVGEALHELQDRIASISLVHEMLYRRGQANTVDLGDYVEAVAEAVWVSNGARDRPLTLVVSANMPCDVTMDVAVPLGLLVTEVLTNGVKHAFPDGAKGRVDIRLEPEDGLCRLTIRDNGIGLPEGAPLGGKAGIGMGVIQSLVEQLEGQARFEADNGAVFHLTFLP